MDPFLHELSFGPIDEVDVLAELRRFTGVSGSGVHFPKFRSYCDLWSQFTMYVGWNNDRPTDRGHFVVICVTLAFEKMAAIFKRRSGKRMVFLSVSE